MDKKKRYYHNFIGVVLCVLLLVVFVPGCSRIKKEQAQKTLPVTDGKEISRVEENVFYENGGEPLKEDVVTYYYYDRLLGVEKELYCILYNSLIAGVESIAIPEYVDYDVVYRVFRYMMFDHPEIFWVNGYDLVEKKGSMILYPSMLYAAQDIEALQAKCDVALIDMRKCLQGVADEYGISKAVYDYLVEHVSYSVLSDEQNMLPALLGDSAVCTGLVKAYQYYLQQFGIESVPVTGFTKEGTPHMWNLVKIDGVYYYTDVTYGVVNKGKSLVNYEYFHTTTQAILSIYQIEAGQILQDCVSMDASYYVKNGCYYSQLDKEALKRQFQKGLPVVIKCSGKECFEQMKRHLILDKGIYEYLEEKSIQYVTYEQERKLYFYTEGG